VVEFNLEKILFIDNDKIVTESNSFHYTDNTFGCRGEEKLEVRQEGMLLTELVLSIQKYR
tara:strand:+ start:354 stop:533 length:180 start_codon:yes stop_codon:yes gene_type:complete